MKNNKRKQSNPTLTELLDPYLRNPPSPPPLQPPQSPAPQSLPYSSSLPTVQRDPARLRRQFHTSAPQFYQVHPSDFRALVKRLTGANASATNNNRPPTVEERRVENIHNVIPRIEEELALRDKSDSNCYAPATLSTRSMVSMGDFCSEKTVGESSNMGSPSSYE